MKHDEINKSLVETLKSSNLGNISIDFSEIALDQLTKSDGVAKDIPIVGILVKLIKFGISVKDIIFLKKLNKFLWHMKDIPHSKRVELIEKLENDSKYNEDVGAKIMLLLERADDFQKPAIMATAFKAYLYNEITTNQLQKINFGIDHLFINDIRDFISFFRDPKHPMDQSTHQNLALCGFATLIQTYEPKTKLVISKLGKLFANKILEKVNF